MFKDPKSQFFYDELKKMGFPHMRAVLWVTGNIRANYETLSKRWRKVKNS